MRDPVGVSHSTERMQRYGFFRTYANISRRKSLFLFKSREKRQLSLFSGFAENTKGFLELLVIT